MSFSELQYKYESAFGPLDEPICTLENIRRLGTVQNSILVSLGHQKRGRKRHNAYHSRKARAICRYPTLIALIIHMIS